MARKQGGPPLDKIGETILEKNMDEVMHSSMLPYAEHVILERALPRVEDGLKPVQRRILYTMMELGLSPDKPHRKSARIVGDALGKYHPHGDSSVYDAMVRMAQSFNMQAPLVDGHGNFGSIDGDCAAAMRYTEARMTPLAMELLRDIDKDTVKFSLNFDDTLKEPDLLPGRFPNLLVNGSSGIAVGLATNIPPHNLREAVNAVVACMDNPDIGLDELMKVIPCPDFPTGGYLLDSGELKTAYETGRGKVAMRAKASIEEARGGKKLIVITELPYQVNKARVLEDILKVSQEKKALFAGIGDIRDESDRTGMRAVVEVKKDADADKLLKYLYKYTDLQCTFGFNMVAIAGGRPRQMGLKEILTCYIRHQEDVVTRRTRFDLENAQKREHVLEGLTIAILNIDEVIAIIRASKTPKAAREALMDRFSLTEIQAQAILDLRLQRLTNLELAAIEREYREIKKLIRELKAILGSPAKLHAVIRSELIAVRDKYAVPRRTSLISGETQIKVDESELKAVEEVVVAVLADAKIRRIPRRSFNLEQIADEKPQFIIETETDKRLRFFTNMGAALTLNVEDIPETRSGARPSNLMALLPFENGEFILSVQNNFDEGTLLFFTKNGYAKRTEAAQYCTRVKRLSAVSLKDGDEVIGIERGRDGASILMVTQRGMSIRFSPDEIPCMGRVSAGVRGIKLEAGDRVVYARQTDEEGELVIITDRGYAKRSFIFDYELQGRYGKGLKTFDFKKNGSNGTCISSAFQVKEPFKFIVEQAHGAVSEFSTEDILIEPRFSRGMPLVTVILDDIVTRAYKKPEQR